MGESLERYADERHITCHAAEDVVGQTFAVVSDVPTDGNYTIRTAGAGARAFGVIHRDRARGLKVGVNRKIICTVIAGGTVNPGDEVSVGTGGKAVRATAVDFTARTAASAVVAIAATGGARDEPIEVALI